MAVAWSVGELDLRDSNDSLKLSQERTGMTALSSILAVARSPQRTHSGSSPDAHHNVNQCITVAVLAPIVRVDDAMQTVCAALGLEWKTEE